MKKFFVALAMVLMTVAFATATAEIKFNMNGVSGTIGVMNGRVNNFDVVRGDISVSGNGNVVIFSNGIDADVDDATTSRFIRKEALEMDEMLEVKTDVAEVSVFFTEDDCATFEVRGDCTEEPKLTLREGFVELECNGIVSDMMLDIYLPAAEYRKLSIETMSGDVFVDQVSFDEVEIYSMSGDVWCAGASHISLQAKTLSGDIECVATASEEEAVVSHFKISTMSGDIVVE